VSIIDEYTDDRVQVHPTRWVPCDGVIARALEFIATNRVVELLFITQVLTIYELQTPRATHRSNQQSVGVGIVDELLCARVPVKLSLEPASGNRNCTRWRTPK